MEFFTKGQEEDAACLAAQTYVVVLQDFLLPYYHAKKQMSATKRNTFFALQLSTIKMWVTLCNQDDLRVLVDFRTE